jgi:hypothetical protein
MLRVIFNRDNRPFPHPSQRKPKTMQMPAMSQQSLDSVASSDAAARKDSNESDVQEDDLVLALFVQNALEERVMVRGHDPFCIVALSDLVDLCRTLPSTT